jgi:Transglycosylase SLT domain
MLRITPCRTKISDRFPIASFIVEVPPQRYFEIACATDPELFRPDHIGRRTPGNFSSSRASGLLRAPAGQATYIVPPDQLRRFAGSQRLYYALGAYGNPSGDDPAFTTAPDAAHAAPCIQLASDFTGRALDRNRLGTKRPADQRYGAVDRSALAWGGDQIGKLRSSPNGAPRRLGTGDARESLPYDDGYDTALWGDNPSDQDETNEYLARRRGEEANRAEAAKRRRDARAAAEADGTLQFLPVRGIENVSEEFKDRVYEIATDLGIDTNHLMAVMSFETGGTFSPSVRNAAGSGATGLIQFMPSTAKALGTSVEKLAAMTAEDQLDYVRQYFEPSSGKLKNVEDTYMAVLWPAGIGKGSAHVIFRKGDGRYEQNAGLDTNGDGEVTVGEAAGMVSGILIAAEEKAKPKPSANTKTEGQAMYGNPVLAARLARQPQPRWTGEEPEGYEDAPDLARRMGRRQAARYGGAAAAFAAEDYPPAGLPVPDDSSGGAPGDRPPTELAARFYDFSEDDVPEAELPDEVATGLAADDVEDTMIPFDASERLRIVDRVATFESGGDVYSAINADTEFGNAKLPGFFMKRHVGLSWGFIQFAQAFGGLGKALAACQRRDEAAFQSQFGQNWQDLLSVTNAGSEAQRLALVIPPGDSAPLELWKPAWTSVFRAAGRHRPFQEAQREVADTEYYEPYTTLLWWLGFSGARAQAMFFDRSIQMGPGAAIKWIVETVGPIKSKAQRDAALAYLGFPDLRSFQATPPFAGASWLVTDGVWGARTHAALIGALRRKGGGPIAVPTRDQMLDLMVKEAERLEKATAPADMTWSLIATRLRKLLADPALAELPRAT